MADILYRHATREDIAHIVEFQIAMAQETEGVGLDRRLCTLGVQAVFDDPRLGRYLVAVCPAVPVASLLITTEWSDWRNGLVWWIQSVYVRPEHRRRGVYAGLYRHVRQLAEADDSVKGIRLYVDRTNAAAQAVYRRLGMDGEHYRVFEWMKPASAHPDG